MNTIRFVVITREQLMRNLIAHALMSVDRRFRCVAELPCSDELGARCQELRPDLVVFEISGHDAAELIAVRRLLKIEPAPPLVVIAGDVPAYLLEPLIVRPACGLVSHHGSLDALGRVAFLVASGGTFVDATLHGLLQSRATPPSFPALSVREQHVLQLVGEGYTTKEVATLLNLSVKTVDKYRTSLMQKLDVHDVVKLTHWAIRMGLVQVS